MTQTGPHYGRLPPSARQLAKAYVVWNGKLLGNGVNLSQKQPAQQGDCLSKLKSGDKISISVTQTSMTIHVNGNLSFTVSVDVVQIIKFTHPS